MVAKSGDVNEMGKHEMKTNRETISPMETIDSEDKEVLNLIKRKGYNLLDINVVSLLCMCFTSSPLHKGHSTPR